MQSQIVPRTKAPARASRFVRPREASCGLARRRALLSAIAARFTAPSWAGRRYLPLARANTSGGGKDRSGAQNIPSCVLSIVPKPVNRTRATATMMPMNPSTTASTLA